MVQNNLPEVMNTVRGLMSYDNGDVFGKGFLFSKKAEKRLDAQKEILLRVMDTNELKVKAEKEIGLAKIEAEKEIELAKVEARKEIELVQLKCSFAFQELKHETFRQFAQIANECNSTDLNKFSEFISSGLSNIANDISRL